MLQREFSASPLSKKRGTTVTDANLQRLDEEKMRKKNRSKEEEKCAR
jgi:hypothetical protein